MKTLKQFTLIFTFLICQLTFSQSQEFEIYVSDAGNFQDPPWQILKFDQNGENPITFIDDQIAWPQDIVFLEEQEVVLISSLNSGRITKHDIESGDFIEDFASGIGGPTRMKIGQDGLLYVLQWLGNGRVFRYQQDGTFVDEFTDIGVPQSIGLDWDDAGNLYVSSFTGDSVEMFDANGNFVETFIDNNLVGPTNIWFGENGDLFVIDYSGGAVKRFDSDGNYIEDFIPGLNFGEGVDFFPDETILIGDGQNAAVNLYEADGTFIEQYITSGSGGLLTPNAVILRETDTFSVDDVVLETTPFMIPSIGDTFTIQNDVISLLASLRIYNVNGQLIETVNLNQTSIWDATHLSEGIYFATAISTSGNKQTQKIVVCKK